MQMKTVVLNTEFNTSTRINTKFKKKQQIHKFIDR